MQIALLRRIVEQIGLRRRSCWTSCRREHASDKRDIGLARKARHVRVRPENRIDFSVLPDLTDQDLEKLGLLLGDRRKMLRAIAKLEGAEKNAPAVASAASAPAAPVLDSAERRQVTVMFSDLVGSTATSWRPSR
jgi:SAM domain (Sterile alpha motif)